MNPLKYFNASSQQVAKHPVAVKKLEWRGGDSLAAARFIQVHDAYTTPAEGSVPLKSWAVYTGAAGYKLFDVGELELTNGLYVCVSTTEATKTLASGSDKFASLLVETLEAEAPSGTSFAGDLSTADEILPVWTDAAGPKRLFEIITTNNSFGVGYLQIHAANAGSLNTASIVEEFEIADGETKRLTFGKSGREASKVISNAVVNGCTLAYSATSGTYTAVGLNGATIQA
ncbi:MAG: hypothetical protein D4R57_01020, partial [Verrucomicrobiales bacterium]